MTVEGIRARSSTPLTSSAEVIPASLSLAAKSGTGVSRMRPISAPHPHVLQGRRARGPWPGEPGPTAAGRWGGRSARWCPGRRRRWTRGRSLTHASVYRRAAGPLFEDESHEVQFFADLLPVRLGQGGHRGGGQNLSGMVTQRVRVA